MAGNTVKLTFVGDSTSLDKSFKHVGAEAESVSHKLKDTSAQARSLKTTMRGAGEAASIFGGQLGASAVQAGYALGSVKDLTKGVGGLAAGIGVAGVAVAGVTAVVGGLGLAWLKNKEDIGTWSEFGKTAVAGLADGLRAVTGWMPILGAATDRLADKADRWADANNRVAVGYMNIYRNASLAAQFGGTTDDPDGAFTSAASLQPGTVAWQRLQASADVISANTAKAGRSSGGGGSSIRSAANKVAADAKAAAEKLKQARKAIAQAMGGIVQALAGNLSAADAGEAGVLTHQLNGSFAVEGATRGKSLIEKLRKQALDTKKLAGDLKQLAKMGLDKGLLSQLVQGGLDSLPAAEELLRGGKGDVNTANVLSAQIAGNAGKIAVAEANRNLTKANRVQLDINVKGGTDELGKLLRKWIRTQGGDVQQALGT